MGDARQVHSTASYLYRVKDRVGTGAFSYVYRGVHKGTGETYALKVPRSGNSTVELERETIALSTLQHANIVRLYDIQNEIGSGRMVFVMEYCPRGSVLNLLEEPENHHGLHDIDIITLISNIASALKYLTTMGFVHRDIKPGNILVSETEVGRKLFKLSDFGSSKYVQESNEYESLTGTEEYLHPMIYERAFIDRGLRGKFTSSTDLWSLGATLVHAILGEVPFRPYEGSRKNRNEMFIMISRKPDLAIYGRQNYPNGKIEYYKEIPLHCNISRGLRLFVVRIIRGLLKTDSSQWTLDTFCMEADQMRNLTPCVVLDLATLTFFQYYTEPSSTIDRFLKTVSESFPKTVSESMGIGTDIKSSISYNGLPLKDIVECHRTVVELPTTSKERPLVFMSSNNKQSDWSNSSLPSVPSYPDTVSVADDRRIARKHLTVSWKFMTITEHFFLLINVLRLSCQSNIDAIINSLTTYEIKLKTSDELFTSDSDRLSLCQSLQLDPSMADYVGNRRQDAIRKKKQIALFKNQIKEMLVHLRSKVSSFQDQTCWNTYESKVSNIKQKALHYFHEVERIWKQVRDRKAGNVSDAENLIRLAERKQLQTVSRSIFYEHQSVFVPYKDDIVNHIKSWIRNYLQVKENFSNLEMNFTQMENIRKKFTEDIVFVSAYTLKPKEFPSRNRGFTEGILHEHRSNCERLMSLISDVKVLAMTDGNYLDEKGNETTDDLLLFG